MNTNLLGLSTLALFSCIVIQAALSTAADVVPFGSSKSQDTPVIQLGPVEVHPFLSVQETYSDNIFLVPDYKKHDFITTLAPGAQLKLPFRRHALFLSGTATIVNYAKYSSENKTDWTLSGAGDFYFGSRINLKISDSYLENHEPRSQSAVSYVEKYKNNNASASLTYVLADVSKLQLDYTNAYWKFKNSGFRSRDENTVSAYAYYRVMPKTSLFTEYEFKNVYFTEKAGGSDLDNKVHSALFGLTWELSELSKGTVKGGYLYKTFDDTSRKDFGTFVASLELSHRFSDYNAIKLAGAREVNESSLLGTSYSISTGINGEFTHKFNDRFSAALKAAFNDEVFSNVVAGDSVKRNDQVVLGGAKATYAFRRWMDSTLEYYIRRKDSNVSAYDSTENNISLTLKAFF